MIEQWQELKETIIEMRDNDGTGTQQEVCKFLTNYMDNLEKQMQQPCEDCISREETFNKINTLIAEYIPLMLPGWTLPLNIARTINELPPVTPQPKTGQWIRQTDDYHDYYECEHCGIAVGLDDVRNYCPNCGAKMEAKE